MEHDKFEWKNTTCMCSINQSFTITCAGKRRHTINFFSSGGPRFLSGKQNVLKASGAPVAGATQWEQLRLIIAPHTVLAGTRTFDMTLLNFDVTFTFSYCACGHAQFDVTLSHLMWLPQPPVCTYIHIYILTSHTLHTCINTYMHT